jgi:PEP-CTERM motif
MNRVNRTLSAKRSVALALGAFISGVSVLPSAHAGLLGPTAYLSFADSPFAGGSFSFFYLETFEDHLLNAPGVSASAGGTTGIVYGASIHDSVDVDDGVIDGSGLAGDSYFSWNGAAGISFIFDAVALGGALPDSVGIVWTDGSGTTLFQAFDAANNLLGTYGPGAVADGTYTGTTGEDRFFGITGVGGISRIFISNTEHAIEVDHLQYGLSTTASSPPNSVPDPATVPEPTTLALLAVGAAGLGVRSVFARSRPRRSPR